jgi:hypothetical protein
MNLVNEESLGATLDNIAQALFFAAPISKSDRAAAAGWIAARQGLPGSYAGMFAPLPLDFQAGVALFTGERVTSGAGTAHILGQEALRALHLLGPLSAKAAQALQRAEAGMAQRLGLSPDAPHGRYCCGTCSVAVWRNMLAGSFAPSEAFLAAGLAHLQSRRDGAGRWRGYPYHYALLALADLPQPQALAELRYSAPVLERLARRKPDAGSVYAQRRTALAQRILARC